MAFLDSFLEWGPNPLLRSDNKERYKSFSLFPNAQSTDYAHGYSPFVAYPTAHDESIHKRLLNQSPALLLMQVYL